MFKPPDYVKLVGDAMSMDIDLQEAFISLLNAQEILGDSCEGVPNVDGDEHWAVISACKIASPYAFVCRFSGEVQNSPNAYSHLIKAFTLGAIVVVHLKLWLIERLFVPFEVLLLSNRGILVPQYLHNPFLAPQKWFKIVGFIPSIVHWMLDRCIPYFQAFLVHVFPRTVGTYARVFAHHQRHATDITSWQVGWLWLGVLSSPSIRDNPPMAFITSSVAFLSHG